MDSATFFHNAMWWLIGLLSLVEAILCVLLASGQFSRDGKRVCATVQVPLAVILLAVSMIKCITRKWGAPSEEAAALAEPEKDLEEGH